MIRISSKLIEIFKGLNINETKVQSETYYTIAINECNDITGLLYNSNYKTLDEAKEAIINSLESQLF